MIIKNKFIVCILIFSIFFTSCVTSTNVSFTTDIEGTEVIIDGKSYGTEPGKVKISNAMWEEPKIVLRKDGYKTKYGYLKKEVKVVNAIFGVLGLGLWPSYLWIYGPKSEQYYIMTAE